ncbi:unnamed protein product [Caenorhabditis angaria]|uniref:Thioredoxin domain-containing protein n=1 Tax=Caenorhabditis angaria TaxID=860376 RepID=A0A9P1MY59_9PELO|nr:unnamed protein product [Caenorhabditis angaria]
MLKILVFFLILQPIFAQKPLNSLNFEKEVGKSQRIWLVEIGAESKSALKSAKNLVGLVEFGLADAKLAAKFGAKNGDVLVFLDDKKKPKKVEEAANLDEFVLREIGDLVKLRAEGKSAPPKIQAPPKKWQMQYLKDADFEKTISPSKSSPKKIWFVLFFAPWCGHCKKFEPEFRKAAEKMAGKVEFAQVDCTQNQKTCGRFGVQGYPTVKFFGVGGTSDFEDYNGARDWQSVVEYTTAKFEKLLSKVEILEGVDQNLVQNACGEKALCVFSFLPHILDCDLKCRKEYLGVIEKVSEVFKGRNWAWIWNEGGAQPKLESTFEIGGFGYPALAIFSPKKLRFSTMRGSFSTESIKEFLTSIGSGKLKVDVVDEKKLDENGGFLKIETIQKWNENGGKDEL